MWEAVAGLRHTNENVALLMPLTVTGTGAAHSVTRGRETHVRLQSQAPTAYRADRHIASHSALLSVTGYYMLFEAVQDVWRSAWRMAGVWGRHGGSGSGNLNASSSLSRVIH